MADHPDPGELDIQNPNDWEYLTQDTVGLCTTDGRALLRKVVTLGAGNYGYVCAHTHEATGERVAVKTISKTGNQPAVSISREFGIASELRHPNIVAMHAAFQTETHVKFVMELVEGENLRYKLLGGSLPHALACRYLLQLVSALKYLHGKNILHRHLTPGNVMLTPRPNDGYCKLIDFGLSKRIINGFARGTLFYNTYLAPELSCGPRQSTPADVFGLGYILYRCLLNREPYPSSSAPNKRAVLRVIMAGPAMEEDWDALPANAQGMLDTLLQCSPAARPKLEAVTEFPWVKEHKAAAAAVCPPVPGAALVYLAGEGYRNNLATEVARIVPTPMRKVVSEIMSNENTEATMLYKIFRCRDAKKIHGLP